LKAKNRSSRKSKRTVRKKMKITLSFLLTASAFGLNTARFEEVVAKLESHVLEYRDFMESLYLEKRCDETSLMECQAANYDESYSALPNPTCPSGPDFSIPLCGLGDECSGYVDFTKSVYRIAPGTDVTDPLVIESVCFSRFMDDWLIQRNEQDRAFWEKIQVQPRAMYFGSTSGAFRIYPGRHSEQRGIYDPTIRPWYVAGSSGPKNIVLVLDKSGSMQGSRMSLMKEAAIRVIETLTISDRVAIVVFDETAKVIADEGLYLYQATNASKAILIDAIANLEAKGATNYYDALTGAFDVLDSSIGEELAVSCNSAILFLTDGEMTDPEGITPANVTELVARRLNATSTAIGKPVMFFSYSVSEAENVHTLPKELACSTEFGTWSRIASNDKIVEALSSYYRLFALGLGIDGNVDFTAWVEPYSFATGNTLGTTVSAPLYDRTKSPHLFLGVVAIDIALEALNRALETDNSTESIAQLARRSVAVCPTLELTQCELDSYRAALGGEESRCLQNLCSADDLVETIATQCTDSSKYPDNLLANEDAKELSYEESTCCVNNNASDTGVCVGSELYVEDEDGLSKGAIAGIAVGGAVGLLCLVFVCFQMCGGRGKDEPEVIYVRPLPTAPHQNPPIAHP
jgi:Mg-chelatase subunit ChlD